MSTELLKFPKGTARVNRWQFQDIHITHSHSNFTKPSKFSASRNDEMVRLHFGLKGDYSFYHNQLQRTFTNIGGTHNVMYSKGFDIEVNNQSLDLETFGIQFPKELFIQYTQSSNDLLKKFAENIMNGKSVLLSENWKNLDYPTHQVIQQIIQCKYKGDLKDLFLLSKSIELLVIACEAHSNSNISKSHFIHTNADKNKIISVKELIQERLQNPPNLNEISRTIGINEYKLKGGFKEIFGTTIFGYIREERLKLAYSLLIDTEKPIGEIADELGYSSQQHFSNAFKKKFNQSPLKLRKNH